MTGRPDNDARYDDSRETAATDHGDVAANRRDAWTMTPAHRAESKAAMTKYDAELAWCALNRKHAGPNKPADVQVELDRLAAIAWPA